MLILIPAVATILAIILLMPAVKSGDTPKARRRVVMNSGVFLMATLMMVVLSVGAAAADPAEAAAAAAGNAQGMGFLAAALSTGLSCLGAGIAIASTAPAAIGAFSEDPKAFGKAMIFVVLGEGVALYGVLISILLIAKL